LLLLAAVVAIVFVAWLVVCLLLIFSPRYMEGLKHIKTLVNDKQGWKQHSQWIKSFKGCIQLVSCSWWRVLMVIKQ